VRCGSAWPIELTGTRVRVRSLTEADLGRTLEWRNHPQSRQWFKSSALIDEGTHRAWYRSYSSKATELMFFVETWPDREPLGQGGIYDVDTAARRAEVGRFVSDPRSRGQGLFREALELMLDHAFGAMRLDEVHLEVVPANERAIRLYRSLGFVDTGDDGSMLHMSLRARDFAAHRPAAHAQHGK
jgi:RimJ/RimL family protein N-acetyltransferase